MNKGTLFGMTLVVLAVSSAISGCGGGDAAPPPPLPTITSISPDTAVAGGAAFMLTITGTNFVAASMVNFGGTAHAVTLVSATQLTATIPASAIVSDGTVAITVTNPAPGGSSNAVNFTIANSQSPPPTGVTVTPSGAMVQPGGVQQFTAMAR
ncbi:MAG TPA: IPT/TIG domain-containing protein [Candidatus Acidoferrum sp.]|nr:IPT/TIG domain-containing protein [Candidatus Acidoferrum sp.]